MRRRIGSKERIRRFLLAHIGEVVTASQIQEAIGPEVTEWARRVRELRGEEGWQILTHHDDNTLRPGEYRLAAEPPPPGTYQFSRSISGRLRSQVLERNGYTCQMCGAAAGERGITGRTVRIHIGHIVHRSQGGEDTLSNLRALCSDCNEGAQNLTAEPPSFVWLISQVRRARLDDQRRVYEWLHRKFGGPTETE